MNSIDIPTSSLSFVIKSNIWACTVTSNAVVGSSAISNLGLFEPSVNPVFDDGSNEDLLSIISDANIVAPQKVNTKGIVTLQPDNILANTGDAFNYLDFDAEDLLGGTPTPKKSKPTIINNIKNL